MPRSYDESIAPMPLTYEIDHEQQIVTIRGDYATPDEWRALLAGVAQDPGYPGGYGFLRDLRTAAHPVTAESVMGIVAVVREFWSILRARRAAVLTRPAIDAPALMAHALAEDEQIPLRTFNSYEDAMAWLKLP